MASLDEDELDHTAMLESAWTTTLMQAIRTFVLPRVTAHALAKELPAAEIYGAGATSAASSAVAAAGARAGFCAEEVRLLQWISAHHAVESWTGRPRPVVDFGASLADGTAFVSLLKS